jgi:S-DNA-T family DNA segregation ATPase FtsK/SpoIIIE
MKRSGIRIFPQSFITFLETGALNTIGAALIVLSILAGVSLLSYSPLDASLNTASALQPANVLGAFGAYTADFLYQTFGDVSWALIVGLVALGWRTILLKKNAVTIPTIIGLIISLTLFCISIQCLFDEQICNNHYSFIKTHCGVIGFVLTKRIYFLMRNHGWLRCFFPAMFVLFMVAAYIWKRSTKIMFGSIWAAIIKVFREIKKLCGRQYILRKISGLVPKFAFTSFRTAGSFTDACDDTMLENATAEELPDVEKLNDNFPATASKSAETKRKNNKGRSEKNSDHANFGEYQKPSVELLTNVKEDACDVTTKDLSELSKALLNVLSEFGIDGEIVGVLPGPVVTMYEFRPAPGIKTSRVISLADDIARYMSALSARIATIPGKNAIGIELPNDKRLTVFLRPLLQTQTYTQSSAKLPLILGKDISGKTIIADLVKMPHLLVAGTTGSGKSVSINTMILSLIYKFTPEQCKFIMVDPKMLELSVYDDIPHLLTPVVTEPKKAIFALKWAVREMESRYKAMSRLGVRNIENFNQKVQVGRRKGDVFTQRVQTGFDQETGLPIFEDQPLDYKEYPYIVVVVDEMADLMLVAGKEIESAVQRLAQMARAAGIHLIMATQRPSVDVITGTIKANFPTRVSFQVTSKIDSRTILGEQGAEQLLGHGDMLYMSGGGRIQRVHGPFVSDNDVEVVARFLKRQGEPSYIDGITDDDGGVAFGNETKGGAEKNLFDDAVEFVRREGRVSISFIQRQFQIGYNKAAKLVEQMEKEGVVSAPDRTGKRELIN